MLLQLQVCTLYHSMLLIAGICFQLLPAFPLAQRISDITWGRIPWVPCHRASGPFGTQVNKNEKIILTHKGSSSIIDSCHKTNEVQSDQNPPPTPYYVRKKVLITSPHMLHCSPHTCGVPQGSVLGPTLFSLYVRDIKTVVVPKSVRILQFADDIMLQESHHCKNTVASNLSTAVPSLAQWLRQRGLILNERKSQVLWICNESTPAVCCNGFPLPVNFWQRANLQASHC